MSNLKFAQTHNLVAFLEKPEESDGFEGIIDFLNASSIRYALTVNPTIYTSCIKQFWATAKAKTVNGEVQIQALVDDKKVIITGASVRRALQLKDDEVFLDKQVEGMTKHKEIYVTPSHTKKVFANMKRERKDFSRRVTPLFQTMMVQAPKELGEGSEIPTDPQHTPTIIQPSTSLLRRILQRGNRGKTLAYHKSYCAKGTTKTNQALGVLIAKRESKDA
ncbi:hypothetical protein Tco_0396349 [Tanacetum coccineum]